MAGKKRYALRFVLFAMLITLLVSCAPIQPEVRVENSLLPENLSTPNILPPEAENGSVRVSDKGIYPVATGSTCSTLMDTVLEETYQVLQSWDFWTFHVNFRAAPPELASQFADADFAGCFRLYGRDDNNKTYYPFEEYLLTPCYAISGDIPVEEPRIVQSTGSNNGSLRDLRSVPTGSAIFDGSAYVRCDFNLTRLERQYWDMLSEPQANIPEGYINDPNAPARFEQVIGSNGEGNEFVGYNYFAMASAISNLAVDFTRADGAWSAYDALGGADSGLKSPSSHPMILVMPKCADASYEELYAMQAEWRDLQQANQLYDDPYKAWIDRVAEFGADQKCSGTIQLGATTLPTGAASTSAPDSRIAITAHLMGQTWHPDFASWGPDDCQEVGECGFVAPVGGGQPTFTWVQFGDLTRVNTVDPCLSPQGSAPAAFAVNDTVDPPARYDYYLNQKYMAPGALAWQTWCSPTMAPSVLTNAQMPLDFWLGDADIYIGYNPITGEQFVGSLDEIWIDPDHSIGT